MKTQKILLAAALLALGAASCQKEENVITQFTAGMEQSEAKTYLGDDSYFYWESTDVVKVYSDASNEGADFTVAPRSGNGTWADLTGFITEGSSYTAIYPASIAVSAAQVNLPAVQTSADGSLAGFPMYAESSTDEFQFKNLCGALRIHLEQANCTISRIELTAASHIHISGTYTVSTTTEGTPSLAYSANGANSVTLTLDIAQPIADGHDFYIYLPDGTYNNMQLTFYQPNGASCTKSGSVTVERSVCTPVTISDSLTFGPASNEIWYTTSNGSPISNPSWTGYTVNRNTYQDGHYVITFASTVTSVPDSAFYNQSNLTSVTLPASVESIGSSAFKSCSNLTSATMPNVTSIGKGAFYGCSSLTSATMPNVESFGLSAFYNCSSLTNLTLSASTNSVSSSAFAGCSSLNVIYLPMSAAPSWLNKALGPKCKAASGTLHVRTGASTAASDWPGFSRWTIVADL